MEDRNWFLGSDPLDTAQKLEALAADLRRLARGNVPPLRAMAVAPVLHGWGFQKRTALCLAGKVYGHPRIGDGSFSITSQVYAIDPERRWARTFSRFYELGPSGMFGGADAEV